MSSGHRTRKRVASSGSLHREFRGLFCRLLNPAEFGGMTEQFASLSWNDGGNEHDEANRLISDPRNSTVGVPNGIDQLLRKYASQYADIHGLALNLARDVGMFSNRQRSSDRCWKFHADQPKGAKGQHVITVVFTWHDGCGLSSVRFSDTNDGGTATKTNKKTKNNGESGWLDPEILRDYAPPHASIYVFPGSHVLHRPNNVKTSAGVRYSAVGMFCILPAAGAKSTANEAVLRIWAASPKETKPFCCVTCASFFGRRIDLVKHQNTLAHRGLLRKNATVDK